MTELPPLNAETLWGILRDTIEDATANQLVWYYLGYRFDAATAQWDNSQVAEDWREAYPEPPDFIESRPATVKLTRSIPAENKQLLKEQLGFEGYKVNELVPRKTRRATLTNWLLSYMALHQLPL
ncbi:DUF1823 family protein [Alkalinema sp. FACHB-956]|uniref:DUF1823 family protein n=1 Tax=Alkalinema sp. FACHB-956 TaxID=2692768 RepID=UPI0016850474|nr:DUF1823 family protein [Alkalinema sp. FACHB-956]MBD2327237.1 DUF1823 family protein [Alkalinema sp. FACHB-956]